MSNQPPATSVPVRWLQGGEEVCEIEYYLFRYGARERYVLKWMLAGGTHELVPLTPHIPWYEVEEVNDWDHAVNRIMRKPKKCSPWSPGVGKGESATFHHAGCPNIEYTAEYPVSNSGFSFMRKVEVRRLARDVVSVETLTETLGKHKRRGCSVTIMGNLPRFMHLDDGAAQAVKDLRAALRLQPVARNCL